MSHCLLIFQCTLPYAAVCMCGGLLEIGEFGVGYKDPKQQLEWSSI